MLHTRSIQMLSTTAHIILFYLKVLPGLSFNWHSMVECTHNFFFYKTNMVYAVALHGQMISWTLMGCHPWPLVYYYITQPLVPAGHTLCNELPRTITLSTGIAKHYLAGLPTYPKCPNFWGMEMSHCREDIYVDLQRIRSQKCLLLCLFKA